MKVWNIHALFPMIRLFRIICVTSFHSSSGIQNYTKTELKYRGTVKIFYKLGLEEIPKQALCVMEAGAFGMTLQPSKIEHTKVVSRFSADRPLAEGAFVGY